MQWVITKTSCDGIGNVMKGYISALSVNPNSVIECNPEYSLGRYDTALADKHIYHGGPREPFYTCRLLVLKEEEAEQETIVNEFQYTNGCGNPRLNGAYSMSRLIDWNYDPERVANRVKARVFRILDSLEFRPQISAAVTRYIAQMQGESLGIAVRTWKASHEHNIDRPYNPETYKAAIARELAGVSTVVLSTDADEALAEYTEFLAQFPVKTIAFRFTDENATQRAFIKMLTLARCDVLIGNRISSFSELAWWFSRHRARVVPLF